MVIKRKNRYFYGDIIDNKFYPYQIGLRVHYLGFKGTYWISKLSFSEKYALITCTIWERDGIKPKRVSLKGVGLKLAGMGAQRLGIIQRVVKWPLNEITKIN